MMEGTLNGITYDMLALLTITFTKIQNIMHKKFQSLYQTLQKLIVRAAQIQNI